jgi:WD40 repeat protein
MNVFAFIALSALLFALGGCDFFSGASSKKDKEVENAYMEYRKAMRSGDVNALKGLVVKEKASSLEAEGAAQALALAGAMTPAEVTVTDTAVEGNAATLTASAGGGLTGTVHLLKEDGRWKLYDESWEMKIGDAGIEAAKPVKLKGGDEAPSFEPVGREYLSPGAFFGASAAGLFLADENKPPAQRLTLKGHEDAVTKLLYSPDGRFLISAGYGDFTIRMWDARDGRGIMTVKLESRPLGMDISPDGKILVLSDVSGAVIFMPVDENGLGEPAIVAEGIGNGSNVAVSPNGRLFATASFDKIITIGDMNERVLIRKINTPEPMRSVAFSPSGQLLAASSAKNKFTLWDIGKGEGRTYTVSNVDPASDVGSIAFSPDGKYLATGHMDSSTTIWDVEKQKEMHNFYVSNSSTWVVRFSPDSKVLATGQQDRFIYLRDSKTSKIVGLLSGHKGAPRCLAFSPDGMTLASGAEDGNIIIWR